MSTDTRSIMVGWAMHAYRSGEISEAVFRENLRSLGYSESLIDAEVNQHKQATFQPIGRYASTVVNKAGHG